MFTEKYKTEQIYGNVKTFRESALTGTNKTVVSNFWLLGEGLYTEVIHMWYQEG